MLAAPAAAAAAGQSTGLVRHVFRLLAQANSEQRPVPWVLLENVSGAGAAELVLVELLLLAGAG
jgi:hypothetical protein